MMQPDRDAALEAAIAKAGSSRALAQAIGVTPQALSQWRRVPLARVFDVERFSGIPRHELRPDFFGAETQAIEAAGGEAA